jgi:hypothetical protein
MIRVFIGHHKMVFSRYGAAVLMHEVLCIAARHTRWLSMICFSLEIIFARTMWFKQ